MIIGSVMGDAIADVFGMEWVVYTDENGSDFAIAHPEKTVFAFPQDMLVKRFEEGEPINISELFFSTIETLTSVFEKAANKE